MLSVLFCIWSDCGVGDVGRFLLSVVSMTAAVSGANDVGWVVLAVLVAFVLFSKVWAVTASGGVGFGGVRGAAAESAVVAMV